MFSAKAFSAMVMGLTLGCGGGDSAESAKETDAPQTSTASAADLPDPCALVTDREISDLLWRGLKAGQREALQARNAEHVFTKRVENVEGPFAGRTCYFEYRRVAGDSVWGEGDFQLRTLSRQAFQIFADDKPASQDPIAGVGDQAFYASNSAYARRGDVGVQVVEFHSKDLEIELLKHAVARLP